ncbi:MAG: hypothetical protein DMG08_16715 [Acidobacteria bacterium]|nr:MAG: hypothetical protein DMG08_16715 [Acidobacteriota bacterium]
MSIARLKPGVTLAQARAEMDAIGRRLARQYPKDNADKSATVTRMDDYGLRDHWKILRALLAAVGFVLLIACVNVANLMLARGSARQKELAIRRALGAGRWRIVRQMLTESLLLAGMGGISGLLLASWGMSLLAARLPNYLRYVPFRPLDTVTTDGRVLVFTLAVSCLTGILFGLAPALSAFRTGVNEPLKGEGRGTTRWSFCQERD